MTSNEENNETAPKVNNFLTDFLALLVNKCRSISWKLSLICLAFYKILVACPLADIAASGD